MRYAMVRLLLSPELCYIRTYSTDLIHFMLARSAAYESMGTLVAQQEYSKCFCKVTLISCASYLHCRYSRHRMSSAASR